MYEINHTHRVIKEMVDRDMLTSAQRRDFADAATSALYRFCTYSLAGKIAPNLATLYGIFSYATAQDEPASVKAMCIIGVSEFLRIGMQMANELLGRHPRKPFEDAYRKHGLEEKVARIEEDLRKLYK